MLRLFEKISSLGPEFIQTGRDAWKKNIDRILSKRVKGNTFRGSFSFEYLVPEDVVKKMKSFPWNDKQAFTLTVDVRFSPLKAFTGGHKKGESFGSRKLIVINTTGGTYLETEELKERLYSTYIHELQHIPQEYNELQNWSIYKSSARFDNIKSKTKNWKKFWQHGDHDRRENEHESNLAQLLEFIKEDKIKQAVDFVIGHASYMQFTFKQFINKAHHWGCTSDQINSFRKAVETDVEVGTLDPHVTEIHYLYKLINVFAMLKVCKSKVELLLQKAKEDLESSKQQMTTAINRKDYLVNRISYLEGDIQRLTNICSMYR